MTLDEYRKKRQQDPVYTAAKKELKPLLDFADRVLDFRLANSWTQSELARRMGVSRVSVSRVESGTAVASKKFTQAFVALRTG